MGKVRDTRVSNRVGSDNLKCGGRYQPSVLCVPPIPLARFSSRYQRNLSAPYFSTKLGASNRVSSRNSITYANVYVESRDDCGLGLAHSVRPFTEGKTFRI